jgi:hypothetical protein
MDRKADLREPAPRRHSRRAAAALVLTGGMVAACTDPAEVSPPGPDEATMVIHSTSAMELPAPLMTRVTATLAGTAQVPCTNEAVEFAGGLRLEFRVRDLGDETWEVALMAQPTEVIGVGVGTGREYRVVGASQSRETLRHRERAVTAADFTLVALASPGAEIGRARVSSVQVHVTFDLGRDGMVEQVAVGDLLPGKECGP